MCEFLARGSSKRGGFTHKTVVLILKNSRWKSRPYVDHGTAGKEKVWKAREVEAFTSPPGGGCYVCGIQ